MRKAILFLMTVATLMTTSCDKDDHDATIAQPAATEILSIADELSADDEAQAASLSKTTSSTSPSVRILFPTDNDSSNLNIGTKYYIYIVLSGIEWRNVGMGFSYTPGMDFKCEKISESGAVRCYRISAKSEGEVKMSVSTCIGEGRDAKVINIASRRINFTSGLALTFRNQCGCVITDQAYCKTECFGLSGQTFRTRRFHISNVEIHDISETKYRDLSQIGYKSLIVVRGQCHKSRGRVIECMGYFFN